VPLPIQTRLEQHGSDWRLSSSKATVVRDGHDDDVISINE